MTDDVLHRAWMKRHDLRMDMPHEERKLRLLLWLRHGCDGLYGDDGEMQCARCGVDFLRDPADVIDERFLTLGLAKLTAATPTPEAHDGE